VDIDRQAVEVTKLSLLLKCLEGESSDSIGAHLFHMKERALPDLAANIKCGNSLIGTDFYADKDPDELSLEARISINAFDWDKEFKPIFAQQGFDAAIGNPPYVLLQDELRDDSQLEYFKSAFTTASYKIDTYHLFIEIVVRLLNSSGMASMITPSNYWTNNHLAPLRLYMLDQSRLLSLTNIGPGVFPKISVDTGIFVLARTPPTNSPIAVLGTKKTPTGMTTEPPATLDPQIVRSRPGHLFTGTSQHRLGSIVERLSATATLLGDLAEVNFGKQLRNRKVFTDDVITVDSVESIPTTHRPCWTGGDVHRYSLDWSKHACLDSEDARCGGCWNPDRHEAKPKLLTPQIGRFPVFAIDSSRWHCLNTMFMISAKDKSIDMQYMLAILNSRLLQAYWIDQFYDQRRTFPKIKGTYLKQLPICEPSSATFAKSLGELSSFIAQLNTKIRASKNPDERRILQQQIDATDREIDRLVYDLYGLTEEEIAIVERATEPAD